MSKFKNVCLVVAPPTTVVKETSIDAVPADKTIYEVSHEELSDELKNAGISPASDPIINAENAPEHSEEVLPPVLPDLIINEKIKDRIPELTAEESMLLDKSLLADGCRDALIVWEGKNTLVDGHNRNAICKRRNIPFNVIYKAFASLEEVLAWVDDNQLGKRNLTIDQKAIIIGRKYNKEKKNSKDNLKQNLPKGQKVPSINVAEKFAKEYHINEKTIKRYGKKAGEYEKIEAKNPALARSIFSGITKLKDVKEKQPAKKAIVTSKKESRAEKEKAAAEKERIQREREASAEKSRKQNLAEMAVIEKKLKVEPHPNDDLYEIPLTKDVFEMIREVRAKKLDLEMTNPKGLLDAELIKKVQDIAYQLGRKLIEEKK